MGLIFSYLATLTFTYDLDTVKGYHLTQNLVTVRQTVLEIRFFVKRLLFQSQF